MNSMVFVLSILLLQGEWELKKDKQDIKVYTRDSETSDFKSFRGETYFASSPEQAVKALRDLANYPLWLDRCEHGEVLEEITEDEYYIYTRMDMPFPTTDRDVVQKVEVIRSDNGAIEIKLSSAPEYIPEVDGYVRIPYSNGHWQLIPLSLIHI